MELNLFNRFKGYEFKETNYPTTFVPDFLAALKKRTCPMCFHRLYLMQNAKLYICRSKKCPQRLVNKRAFVVSASKVDKLQ